MQRCGICSLFSRLIRRAMCVGSRRGSGESYYQELAETAAPDVATMETTDSSIYIRLIPSTTRRMSDSDKDRPLLEALIISDENNADNPKRRHPCNGRFLTMHKRRRKKLQTRSLLQDVAMLDDVLHGQVQCILNQIGNWRFNAFTLETVTGGRSLPVLCVHLFHWYGLLDHFNLDVVRLWKLFTLIEEGYHSTNPYHNSIHATDVTQAMHCFLQEKKILQYLEPLEIMASLIGAVTHDLDHPGVNQPFLIATSNHLAALYENTSVLENHHWRSAVGCLLESGVAEQIQDIRPELEKQISSLILATDITRQNEFLAKFRNYLDKDTLDMRKAEDRHFILQIALKCADISNPCRPWDISKKWSQKVCEEFFRQGDYERQLNLPVTSLCDRYSTSVPKIQTGFFKFVVTPLFDEWHRCLETDLSHNMMGHLKYNQSQWDTKLNNDLAEETRTEISDAEVLEEENEDVEEEDPCIDISDSSEVLLPEVKPSRRSSLQVPKFGPCRFDRRHSMPVNTPKIILPRDHHQMTRGAIEEGVEPKYDNDTFSLLSSDSESGPRARSSADSFPERERPLSAETLVPDLSIATMTDSACANRLNLVMHGASSVSNTYGMLQATSTSKQLIRQQTFPPLHPYIRTRYLSTTTEMGGCQESLIESRSNSSSSSQNDCEPHRGILISKKDSFKRDREQILSSNEKSNKVAKLSITPLQKENLDPTMMIRLNNRRGSAPVSVALQSKASEDTVSLMIRTCDKIMRRGSMPAEVIKINTIDMDNRQSDNNNTTTCAATNLPGQRRSSVPCENTPRNSNNNNNNNNNNGNGRARNRKKFLRRRSASGVEMLSPILAEPSVQSSPTESTSGSTWFPFRYDLKNRSQAEEIIPQKRRGSLPVDGFSNSQSGKLRH